MKLLEYPEIRYGPLPKVEQAQRLLLPRPDLQTPEGALKYLELHLNRTEDNYAYLTAGGKDFWTVLLRLKAKKSFTNTTRALRMIMVFHHEDKELLGQMAVRIKEKQEQVSELVPHYSYLLRLLKKLGSPEAE